MIAVSFLAAAGFAAPHIARRRRRANGGAKSIRARPTPGRVVVPGTVVVPASRHPDGNLGASKRLARESRDGSFGDSLESARESNASPRASPRFDGGCGAAVLVAAEFRGATETRGDHRHHGRRAVAGVVGVRADGAHEERSHGVRHGEHLREAGAEQISAGVQVGRVRGGVRVRGVRVRGVRVRGVRVRGVRVRGVRFAVGAPRVCRVRCR